MILTGPKREPEGTEERPALLVVDCGGGDGDVHATDLLHLVVVDLGKDQLLGDPETVVAPAVERAGVEAPEVPDPRQGDGQQPVEELPHPVTPQRHLGADRHALPELEPCDGAPGLRHHRLLAGDDPQVVDRLVEGLRFLGGLADAHIEDNLDQAGDRHGVEPGVGHELGTDLVEVAGLEPRPVAAARRGGHQASSASQERQRRIFVPSSSTENPTRVGPQFGQTSVTLDRSTGSSFVTMPPSWPPPRADGRTFSWRLTRWTPSTSTRFLRGKTAITRPSLPASLPDRTWTRSPLRTRAAISGHRREDGHAESVPAPRAPGARRAHSRRLYNRRATPRFGDAGAFERARNRGRGPLKHLRRKGNDLHEALLPQFPGHRPEDAGAAGVVLVVDDDHGVVVEADVAAVGAPLLLCGPDDDGLDHVTLLHLLVGQGILDGGDDDVAHARIAALGPPEHLDDEHFAGTRVVGDLAPRLLLDHLALSSTSTTRHRFSFDSGRVSMTRTVSPTLMALVSSWAYRFFRRR